MGLGIYKATFRGLIRQDFGHTDEKEDTAGELHLSNLQAPVSCKVKKYILSGF